MGQAKEQRWARSATTTGSTPTVAEVEQVFARAGLHVLALETIGERHADTMPEAAARQGFGALDTALATRS